MTRQGKFYWNISLFLLSRPSPIILFITLNLGFYINVELKWRLIINYCCLLLFVNVYISFDRQYPLPLLANSGKRIHFISKFRSSSHDLDRFLENFGDWLGWVLQNVADRQWHVSIFIYTSTIREGSSNTRKTYVIFTKYMLFVLNPTWNFSKCRSGPTCTVFQKILSQSSAK